MTSALTPVQNLFTDNFTGSALDTAKWKPLAGGHEHKGMTWTPSTPDTYVNGGGFPTVSNNTARFALKTWDPQGNHVFLGTEAITQDSWNPTTGGLSFEGKFKFSGDGTSNQAALNQGGMIIGFFSYDINPTTDRNRLDFHTEIDVEVFTSNFKNPALNQVSTNVFNGSKNLKIYDPVQKVYVNFPPGIAMDPLSYKAPLANSGYHTYKFEWFPSWINFYLDGKLLRTVTNPDSLPDSTKNQNLHLNLWGQDTSIGHAWGDWTGNPVGDRTLGPVDSQSQGKTYYADFQAVNVNRLSSQLGTANPETLTGTAGNDGMDGRGGNDTLNGAAGDDMIMGGAGNDTIDGGAGSNTAVYSGPRSRYTVTSTGSSVRVVDKSATGDGTDTLTNIAFLAFADQVSKPGTSTSNAMLGTADNDVFDGLGGDDTLTGDAGDDVLMGGDGNDTIDGGTGYNAVSGGAGSDAFDLAAGVNALRDTLADLNGDEIAGFGRDDALDIQGALIGRAVMNVATTGNAATVSVGGSSFEMTGDFSGGEFMTVARGSGADAHTVVTFVPYLPTLAEGVRVDTASINNIANEPFLFGDGSVRFSLELKSATSAFHNTLGVYTVAADGTIGNVRVVFADTLNVASAARTFDLGTPGEHERLAFFLIQDGADFYGGLPNDLSFVKPGTTVAGNTAVDQAVVLHSATRGDLVATPVFLSDPIFNPPLSSSGNPQVLSGVAPGGRELRIGFEDQQVASGDNDFQDVVIGIRALNDDVLIL